MPTPPIDDDCVCGHSGRDHGPRTQGMTLGAVVHAVGVCHHEGCYCGRNPLEWATVVHCSWCSTSDPVVWCVTVNSKRMMIEPEPNPAGNCEIRYDGQGAPFVIVHASPPGLFDDWTPYMPHFATCDQLLRDTKQPARTADR